MGRTPEQKRAARETNRANRATGAAGDLKYRLKREGNVGNAINDALGVASFLDDDIRSTGKGIAEQLQAQIERLVGSATPKEVAKWYNRLPPDVQEVARPIVQRVMPEVAKVLQLSKAQDNKDLLASIMDNEGVAPTKPVMSDKAAKAFGRDKKYTQPTKTENEAAIGKTFGVSDDPDGYDDEAAEAYGPSKPGRKVRMGKRQMEAVEEQARQKNWNQIPSAPGYNPDQSAGDAYWPEGADATAMAEDAARKKEWDKIPTMARPASAESSVMQMMEERPVITQRLEQYLVENKNKLPTDIKGLKGLLGKLGVEGEALEKTEWPKGLAKIFSPQKSFLRTMGEVNAKMEGVPIDSKELASQLSQVFNPVVDAFEGNLPVGANKLKTLLKDGKQALGKQFDMGGNTFSAIAREYPILSGIGMGAVFIGLEHIAKQAYDIGKPTPEEMQLKMMPTPDQAVAEDLANELHQQRMAKMVAQYYPDKAPALLDQILGGGQSQPQPAMPPGMMQDPNSPALPTEVSSYGRG